MRQSTDATAPAFVMPQPTAPSGGHAYNAAVLAAWPGAAPVPVRLPGPWPWGDRSSLALLADALRDRPVALVDGLVGAAHPDLLRQAASAGCRVVLLVHLPLADEGGLSEAERVELGRREQRSVRQAWRVVATSLTAAAQLSRSSGRDVVAVPPGTRPAPPAQPRQPLGIVQVGSIGPRKNQLTSLQALTRCRDLHFTATLVGPVANEAYAGRVRAALGAAGATWTGALDEPALGRLLGRSALLLHPARAETWGMVVTEALARGIPAVVGAGTGAVEALRSGGGPGLPGAVVQPDDVAALAGLLRRWLEEPGLRDEWRTNALQARPGLRRWAQCAAELAAVVQP